jgi:hypothetical protein
MTSEIQIVPWVSSLEKPLINFDKLLPGTGFDDYFNSLF